MKCSVKGCENEAVYHCGLMLRSKLEYEPHKTGPYKRVCEDHKDIVTMPWLLGKYGWEQLRKGFKARGRAMPKIKLSKVYVEKIH